MRRIALITFLAAFAIASTAHAALVNGSFEPVTGRFTLRAPHEGGASEIPGWRVIGVGVEWLSTEPFGFTAPNGDYVIDLAVGAGAAGGISQSLATEPGRTYRVTFWLGSRTAAGADGSARVEANAAGQRHAFTIRNRAAEVLWQAQAFTFIAIAPTTTLEFRCAKDARRHFAFLDGVVVEPADTPSVR